MILLYKVVLSPGSYGDTLHDGLCLDGFPTKERWWNTQQEAEDACRVACGVIGPRPRPGIQHQRPIEIAVFEVRYETALSMARGEVASHQEVGHRVVQFFDGGFSRGLGAKAKVKA